MIPEEVPVYTYAGNDSATTFDFDCLVENENQLDVYFTDSEGNQSLLLYGTDYSIHEFNNSNGSYITYPLEASSHHVLKGESSVGAGDAEKLSLCLTLPIAQESEYGTSSELDLKSLEYSLDYLTRLIQIEARKMERAVKVQEGSGTDTDQLSININKTADNIDTIVAVNNDLSNIDAVKNDLSNIDTCATNIVSIQNASSNAQTASEKANEASVSAQFAENSADESEIWAEGTDEQVQALGGVHSSKGWANVSSQAQIQSDFAQTDNTQKDFIKNKPVLSTSTITLTQTWVGSAAPFTQDVTVAGIVATDNPIVSLIKSDTWTDAEKQINEYAKIKRAVTSADKITFYAEEKTTENLSLLVKLIRE